MDDADRGSVLAVLCCGGRFDLVVEDASVVLSGTHACENSQSAAAVRGLSFRTFLVWVELLVIFWLMQQSLEWKTKVRFG